jgi:hypothetical protein
LFVPAALDSGGIKGAAFFEFFGFLHKDVTALCIEKIKQLSVGIIGRSEPVGGADKPRAEASALRAGN